MKLISHIFLAMMKKMRIWMHLRKKVMRIWMLMMKNMWALVEGQVDVVVGLEPNTEVVTVGCRGELALGAVVGHGIVEVCVVSARWGLRDGEVVAEEDLVDQRTLNVLSV
jgi:hypothetical protein